MTPLAPCSNCGDLVCFTLVVTGRGGESALCVRCWRQPAEIQVPVKPRAGARR